jgi:hypothetical protein
MMIRRRLHITCKAQPTAAGGVWNRAAAAAAETFPSRGSLRETTTVSTGVALLERADSEDQGVASGRFRVIWRIFGLRIECLCSLR